MKYALAILGALGLLFTGPKLLRMAQIKGWVPGGQTTTHRITQKWEEMRDGSRGPGSVYWISWTDRSIQEIGDHRLNLELEQWHSLQVGDPIEIVRVPGDQWPHTRDGIFVSPGNFVFDSVLLGVELWLMWLGVSAFRKRAQARNAAASA